jgi:hypothetical protein
MWLEGSSHAVRNVKMIGWHFGTDGVSVGYRGLVEDCFFKVNDDAVKLYVSEMVVQNCVIWQMENGAPFQISWNMPSDNSGFRVSNIDVIRVEHQWDNKNEAVFDAIHGGRAHMSDYVSRKFGSKTRIGGCSTSRLTRTSSPTPAREWANLRSRVPQHHRNRAHATSERHPGLDADHRVSNVLFENVRINGRGIAGPAKGNF